MPEGMLGAAQLMMSWARGMRPEMLGHAAYELAHIALDELLAERGVSLPEDADERRLVHEQVA